MVRFANIVATNGYFYFINTKPSSMNPTKTLNQQISQLLSESLKVLSPVQSLNTIREKVEQRGLQAFDKQDILSELGALENTLGKLHRRMVQIHDTLENH